jgi:hypothetical protein
MLDARTSKEELRHLADIYVRPFSVPRANGGVRTTKVLERPPVLGSVALAPLVRAATTRNIEVRSSGLRCLLAYFVLAGP